MLSHNQFIFLFVSSIFLPSIDSIRCTTACSYTFNRTTSFSIPDDCTQFVTVNKCIIISSYSYDTDEFNIRFLGIPSVSNTALENHHEAKLTISSLMYFTYRIHRECNDHDDCDRILAKNVATEMQQQQQYNLSGIQNELHSYIVGSPLSTTNPNLTCYDSNQNIQSCGTLTQSGSCVIANYVLENNFAYVCGDKDIYSTPFVDIYQSEHYLAFSIQCNQTLCNNQTTLQQVKSIMYKYEITVTQDGHLYLSNQCSNFIASIVLTIFMLTLCGTIYIEI